MTRDEYYGLHKYCPECGDREQMVTCVPIRTSNWTNAFDDNKVWCKCGWKGYKHDMVAKKVLKNKDI
jgi:hypothetical protein